METNQPVDAAAAAEALQHVHRGRQAAARRVTTPWWYHPVVGVTLAVLVGSASLPDPARTAAVVVSTAALVALLGLYRRLTGLWVNAYEVPGTRRATLLAILTALVVLALAAVLEDALDVPGPLLVAGVLLGAGYVLLWRWIERQLVRLWNAAP
jgi:ABC-type xylose transport system permease subunit